MTWVSTSENQVQFAADVLNKLGAPETYGNLMILVTWMAAEGPVRSAEGIAAGDEKAGPRFNPLSTTKLANEVSDYRPGGSLYVTGQNLTSTEIETARVQASIDQGMSYYNKLDDTRGVMSYDNWDQGVDATVRTLWDGFVAPLRDHLIRGSSLAALAEDHDALAAGFEGWSSSGYSGLDHLDPATFTLHGDAGVTEAVQKYLTSAGQTESIPEEARIDFGADSTGSTASTDSTGLEPSGGDPDALAEILDALGASKGQFFKVRDFSGPGRMGGIPGVPPMAYKYYYALPIFTTAEIAAGEGVAVYWQIDSLPTGVTAVEVPQALWTDVAVANADWIGSNTTGPDGEHITPRFNDAGFFLTPDEDAIPINELLQLLITEAFLAGTEALLDPDIQKIFARIVANPVLLESMETIQLLINDTAWGDARTNLSRGWAQATTAEQEAMVQRVLEDSQSGLYKQFQYYTSTFENPGEEDVVGGRTMREWAEAIAMGEASYWDAGMAIKNYAGNQGEDGAISNAWQRHLHETEVQGNKYEVDREAMIQKLDEMYNRWGLNPGLNAWNVEAQASDVLAGRRSMTEIMDDVRTTAATKFPGKPELLNTTDYALPWVQMYNQEMETPLNASEPLGNEDIMLALTSSEGESPLQFRTRLRGKDEWKRSRRAKEITADKMKTMESTFGFGGGVRRIV